MAFAVVSETDGSFIRGPYPTAPALQPGEALEEYVVGPEQLMTVGRFKLLFTQQERIDLRTAAQTNPQVEDFLDLLAGFTDGVSLLDPVMIVSVNQLVTEGLISQQRADEILAGQNPTS